jgi:hypothetical protein
MGKGEDETCRMGAAAFKKEAAGRSPAPPLIRFDFRKKHKKKGKGRNPLPKTQIFL